MTSGDARFVLWTLSLVVLFPNAYGIFYAQTKGSDFPRIGRRSQPIADSSQDDLDFDRSIPGSLSSQDAMLFDDSPQILDDITGDMVDSHEDGRYPYQDLDVEGLSDTGVVLRGHTRTFPDRSRIPSDSTSTNSMAWISEASSPNAAVKNLGAVTRIQRGDSLMPWSQRGDGNQVKSRSYKTDRRPLGSEEDSLGEMRKLYETYLRKLLAKKRSQEEDSLRIIRQQLERYDSRM